MNARRLRTFTAVLSGGGARGAYEAGVLRFVVHELSRRSGEIVAPRLVSGTSAGALNGCYLAARSGDPAGALDLSRIYQSLKIERIYKFEAIDLLRTPFRLLGRSGTRSLVDASPLHRMVREDLPWASLDHALTHGPLEALVVAATEVGSGRCTYFVDRRRPGPPVQLPYPEEVVVETRFRAEHCLASAAIPFLFPPVEIDGESYQDGGLRQNTPMTPALRLGAERLLVVGVKRALSERPVERKVRPEELSLTFLAGKALNALMLDPIERELHRVERTNQILRWGVETYGPEFVDRFNQGCNGGKPAGWRAVQTLFVRPSADLGQMAAAAWRTGKVAASRPTRMFLGGIASEEPQDEADLLSYLLFDYHYTGALEQLGFEDASRQEEALARLLGLGDAPT